MSRLRWLSVAVAAGLTFFGLPPLAASAAGDFATTVPDANYRACITAKAGASEPTVEQLASITELSCTGKGIADATGTSALPNLTKLFLDNNQLTDLKPLAESTMIFSLGLENNKIRDIGPLASLTQLSAVKLARNQIRDFSVLSTLPKYDRFSGTFNNQTIALHATKDVPAIVPVIIGDKAEAVGFSSEPSGITKSGRTVTYPGAGSYTWQFKNDSLYLNGTVTVTVADDGVTIPDDALRACINSRVGISAGEQPTVAQLQSVSGTLTCQNSTVVDLTGIHLMSGLTAVNLLNNSISDVSPLSALTGLTGKLTLSRNEITSLAGLGSLPSLTNLEVLQTVASASKAKLTTLAGVEKLSGITSLGFGQQAVRNLAPLAGHPSLKTVTATNNLISDVTALASMPQLTSASVDKNQIADLSPLNGKTYTLNAKDQVLTAPEATAEQEADAPSVIKKNGSVLVATPPMGVTVANGKVIYPSGGERVWTFNGGDGTTANQFTGTITQHVKDAPPPAVSVDVPDANFKACLATALNQPAADPLTEEKLASLTKVSCIGSDSEPDKKIVDISGAEALAGATEIVLSTNAIGDVTPLAGLTRLKQLYLPGNAISDPSPLASLTGLEELLLSYNPISSIATLAPLVNLTNLEVTQKDRHTGADLVSLDGVQGMTKLTRLVVNNSSIDDLTPVSGLTSLTNLAFLGNQVGSLTPLSGLGNLKSLQADYNRISDVTPLAGLTTLTSLSLRENQIGDLAALGALTNLGYQSLNVQRQAAVAASVPAQFTTSAPQPRTNTGELVTVTPPVGVMVTGGKVRYPEPGSFVWTFTATDSASSTEFFSGTITQLVTDPVSGAAEIPDPGLRACLREAAGLDTGAVLTEAEVTAIASADCADRQIADLTGAELLTGAVTLNLAGNPLDGVGQLAQLTGLAELDLSGTGLASVAKLAGLSGLTALKVDDNRLADLSPLGGLANLTTVSATGQVLTLADTSGGVEVTRPSVTNLRGTKVFAQAPAGATAAGTGVIFARAGSYLWPFSEGSFSGTFRQRVTTDVVDDPGATHAGAAACVQAGKVWVVVERDTGLQSGGCASAFGTGLEALQSAGFAPTGTGYITAIDGYPSTTSDAAYWSYWHADKPVQDGSTLAYGWTYSSVGASEFVPKAGSVEGWRYVQLSGSAAPSWRLSVKAPTTPETPKPDPSTPVGPAPSPTPTEPTPAPTAKVAPQVKLKVVSLKKHRKATLKVTVSAKGTTPTGKVKVSLAGKSKTVKLNKKGQATITFTKLKKAGKQKATASYSGSSTVAAKSATLKVKIKR